MELASPTLRRRANYAVYAALVDLGGRAARAAIRERARDFARFTEEELRLPPPRNSKHATAVQHHLEWAFTGLKEDGRIVRVEPGVWALGGPPDPPSRERLSELRALAPKAYLGTPEWRARRRRILEREQWRCQLDRRHTEELDVHHNSYERKGVELPEDLVVLCAACHRRTHGTQRPPSEPDQLAA